MELYKDNYRVVTFEPDTNIVYQEWFKETEDMTDQEYKDASVSLPKFVAEQQADKVIINAINSLFMVTPELQDWVNANTIPAYLQAGVQKVAILLPSEIFTHVSIEQIVDDSDAVAKQRIRYFDSNEEARKWLSE